MKLGVLARANSRGLQYQSEAVAREYGASVLLVDVPNHSSRRFPTRRDVFPDAPCVTVRAGWQLDEGVVRRWLQGLTHVYSAETLYDERLADWGRHEGVATVCHVNPEFVCGHWGIGKPSALWSATIWRQGITGARLVPMPADPAPVVALHQDSPRWLHVGGKETTGDRNGTIAVLTALPLLERPCHVRIVTQERRLPMDVHAPPHVEVEVITGGVENPADLYTDRDALVLPRRYGGLCLPVGEAMARGMAVVMTDISPNRDTWPVAGVKARGGTTIEVPAGRLRIADVDPAALAHAMDVMADPWVRHSWQRQARDWAAANSWEALRPTWDAELQACVP